jgi:hypothetical protein
MSDTTATSSTWSCSISRLLAHSHLFCICHLSAATSTDIMLFIPTTYIYLHLAQLLILVLVVQRLDNSIQPTHQLTTLTNHTHVNKVGTFTPNLSASLTGVPKMTSTSMGLPAKLSAIILLGKPVLTSVHCLINFSTVSSGTVIPFARATATTSSMTV